MFVFYGKFVVFGVIFSKIVVDMVDREMEGFVEESGGVFDEVGRVGRKFGKGGINEVFSKVFGFIEDFVDILLLFFDRGGKWFFDKFGKIGFFVEVLVVDFLYVRFFDKWNEF